MDNRNLYEILGVSEKASSDEITAAKTALVKKYHPDVNMRKGIDTTAQMQEILEAYSILIDPDKRAEYNLELHGTTSVMQTFDLTKDVHEAEPSMESDFVKYWKASGRLYEILKESEPLYRKKLMEVKLADLAKQALKHIFILRNGGIAERYWHPDIMNWILFQSYQYPAASTAYLLGLYDNHLKTNHSLREKMKLQKKSSAYIHAIKKLMKY